jgi:hypothetical protein
MAPGRGLFSLFAAWFPSGATIFRPYLWGDIMQASRGKLRLLSARDRQIYVTRPYDGYRTSSCVADSSRLCPASNLPALYPFGVRGIPVRRPTLLPPASFRRASLLHPCLRLPFASVRLGLDFARYLCHKYRPSPFSSRALPGTQPIAEEGLANPLRSFASPSALRSAP